MFEGGDVFLSYFQGKVGDDQNACFRKNKN